MTTPLVVAADPLATLSPVMRWLFERSAPDEPALEMVRPDLTLGGLYDMWMTGGQMPSAIRMIASLLPSRESIWWGWVSARHAVSMVGGKPPTAAMHAALSAVEQWVVRPDDDARRAAWAAGETAGYDSPIGMLTVAVFMSGTTIAPPSVPPVPPPPGTASKMVGAVVQLSAASNSDPSQIDPTTVAFAAQGFEIIKRLGGWEAALQLAYDTHQRQTAEYERATKPPAAR